MRFMRNFTLFLKTELSWIPLSSSKMNYNTEFSAYDEQLEELENDQYNLSFSIVKQTTHINPIFNLLYLGAELRLILDGWKRINLIIKNIEPESHNKTSVYKITAQDEFSYRLSRHNVGYNYNTVVNGISTPKNIFTIAQEVFNDNYMTDWSITGQSKDASLQTQKITLEETNSNPYKVIVDACNILKSSLLVNYETKTVDFYRKNLKSYSGLRYRPNNTIENHSVSYKGENITSILHVTGGTDANNNQISLVPTFPKAVQEHLINYRYVDLNKLNVEYYIMDDDSGIIIDYNNRLSFAKLEIQENDKSELVPVLYAKDEISPIVDEGKRFYYCGTQEYNNIVYDKWRKISTDYTWESDSKMFILTNQVIDNFPSWDEIQSQCESYPIEFSPIFVPIQFKINRDTRYVDKPYVIIQDPSNLERYKCIVTVDTNTKDTLEFYMDPKASDNCYFYANEDDKVVPTDFSDGFRVFNLQIDSNSLSVQQNLNVIGQAYRQAEIAQQEERTQFFNIVRKIPYLGQSLYNFDYFKPYMNIDQWSVLQDLIDNKLRQINIKIQLNTKEYYSAISTLMLLREDIYTLGQNYGAACNAYKQAVLNHNQSQIESLEQDIIKREDELKEYVENSSYFKIIQLLGLDQDLEITKDYPYTQYFINKKYDSQQAFKKCGQALLSYNLSSQERELYRTQQQTLQTLYMGWNIEGQIYTGVYDIIIQTIDSFKKSDKIENGIAQLIHSLEQQRTEQFLRPLYLNYGHFIYESPYTNTDETDSASLFNQAYAHFIDLVNPQGDYSLTVLDIGELEFINIPRLTVGSLISVYNQDAIHSLPFSYYLGKIEESSGNEKIKWENELIAAYRTIYNDKELPAGYEIEYILDHLYHEHLVVTGISRYLREPSRDSVNVQQNSQYKTILSKLIKSIQ